MNIELKYELTATTILGIGSGSILYDMNRKSIRYTIDFLNNVWEIRDVGDDAYFFNDIIFFTSANHIIFVNAKLGHIIYTLNGRYRGKNDGIFICSTKTDGVSYLSGFSYYIKKELWKKKCRPLSLVYTCLNNIYCTFLDEHYNMEQTIYCIDVNKGKDLWQFSIEDFPPYINGFFREQPADIKQIIGVYNDVLWIHVGSLWLVGLDIHTGTQKHLLGDIILGEKGNTFLDVEHGTLKTLGADYYGEFDLTTLQYIKKVRFGENEIIRVRYSTYYPNDKNLYFCGFYNKSGIPNIFGIFDTEKAEVVWYDMKKEDGGAFYNPPQANDKYLAILDDKHNLLIYNREKDE